MTGKLEIIDVGATTFEEEVQDSDEYKVNIGEWYWVHEAKSDPETEPEEPEEDEEEDGEEWEEDEEEEPEDVEEADEKAEEKEPWFGCVIHIGSNYIKLKSPKTAGGGWYEQRIHIDNFHQRCKKERDPESVIQSQIDRYQNRVKQLMGEVQELTRRLAVSPGTQLGESTQDTQALATLDQAQDMDEYKQALIKAKKDTLPDKFARIKKNNEAMAAWMAARVIPMEAQARAMKGVIGTIENRIFSVELYAGLTEEVVHISEGEAAAMDAKVHLMQRMCFMDEECLAQYETGGMEFRHISEFDNWIARPTNRDRILPFPRCIVSFRVRRRDKERANPVDLSGFIRLREMIQADKSTFLYIRNGENVYRMSTSLEFGDKLFPDMEKTDLGGAMWAKMFSNSISEIIPDREYQWMVEEDEKTRLEWEEKKKTIPKKDWFFQRPRYHLEYDTYEPFTPDSVYYDDIAAKIAEQVAHYNRIALILQGLFDRSPVFQPHPKVKMWTPDGFEEAVKLMYDKDYALAPADKPDFEAYRAKLNEQLKRGSMTVGQERAWVDHETEKENERRRRRGGSYGGGYYEASSYTPYGNPGPGLVARVTRFGRTGKVSYSWMRDKQTYPHDKKIKSTFTTEAPNVLNVDAYTPGDFKRFFDDPRTRAEYLEWAPSLLAAEEYHAGNLIEDEGETGLTMPTKLRPMDEPLPDDEDDDDADTEDPSVKRWEDMSPYEKQTSDVGALVEDTLGTSEIGDEWVQHEDDLWVIAGMNIQRILKLIKRARELPPPPREPRPGKRIKIGKGFDICCKQASDAKPTDKMYRRYFLRKRSKKTGKRHSLCMTLSWEDMLKHMGWNNEDEHEQDS